MRRPWSVHSLRGIYSQGCMAQVDGPLYGYAVAVPYPGGRLKAAWWVLTGRAYAFTWPEAGDLEAAIGMPLWNRSAANATACSDPSSRAEQSKAETT
jgi:hypothetical protein